MIKILLVEDDLIVQRVHQLMLTKLGCEVDIAASGKDALDKIRQHSPYNLIFVDIGLPDISGFELIKELRGLELDFLQDTPIIALTGYAGAAEKQACIDAGATEVAYKPIVNNALREILNRYDTTKIVIKID